MSCVSNWPILSIKTHIRYQYLVLCQAVCMVCHLCSSLTPDAYIIPWHRFNPSAFNSDWRSWISTSSIDADVDTRKGPWHRFIPSEFNSDWRSWISTSSTDADVDKRAGKGDLVQWPPRSAEHAVGISSDIAKINWRYMSFEQIRVICHSMCDSLRSRSSLWSSDYLLFFWGKFSTTLFLYEWMGWHGCTQTETYQASCFNVSHGADVDFCFNLPSFTVCTGFSLPPPLSWTSSRDVPSRIFCETATL